MKTFALAAAFVSVAAFAVTPADKASLQTQVDALKASIAALPLDVVPPVVVPPVSAWPSTKPDMLDIDLVNQDSLLKAKYLDGTPGHDGAGTALHYGDMSGLVDSWQPFSIPGKLSNPSCAPRWGVEPNGLRYLESCTDGAMEPAGSGLGGGTCTTCRVINWQFGRFAVNELYYRVMVNIASSTLANQTELGIKLTGLGGTQANGAGLAEIFEIGRKTATGWPLQAYRYDAEGEQGVTPFPNFEMKPDRWYVLEGHVKASTGSATTRDAQGRLVSTSNADGVIEFKVDGVLVYSRKDVKMGANAIAGLGVQIYHGGVRKPAGLMHFKTARIAICKTTWCGPAL